MCVLRQERVANSIYSPNNDNATSTRWILALSFRPPSSPENMGGTQMCPHSFYHSGL